MKTVLLVIALALTITFSGNASNITSVIKNQTENIMVSKTDSSSAIKSGKSKRAHHMMHKNTSGAKKKK